MGKTKRISQNDTQLSRNAPSYRFRSVDGLYVDNPRVTTLFCLGCWIRLRSRIDRRVRGHSCTYIQSNEVYGSDDRSLTKDSRLCTAKSGEVGSPRMVGWPLCANEV